MQSFTFIQGKYNCTVFLLDQLACPCVYCITQEEDADQLANALTGQNLTLVTISGVNWEDDLSPWPALKVFPKGMSFSGGADKFISIIEQRIVPKAESYLGFIPSYRIAAGYSLAGLFSLYTLYRTEIFRRVVCASGSLWYDGFLDFMRNNQMMELPERVYFSLGDKEKFTKNERMATVEDRTMEAQELLDQQGVMTVFVKNKGGHFQEPVERLAKGIRWVVV